MKLETKKQTIELVFRTKKIVDITRKAGCKNFEEVYFKAMKDYDIVALSQIIYSIAENQEKKNPFRNSEEVYDFIDDYLKENNKSYEEMFEELAEAINEEGFFMKKRSKEELIAEILNPLSNIDMDKLVKNSAEKAFSQVIQQEVQEKSEEKMNLNTTEKEFQGFKA